MSGETQPQTHTPGPWRWQKLGNRLILVAQDAHRHIVLVCTNKEDGHGPVLRLRDKYSVMQDATADHPDALLIESAPALLYRLEMLIGVANTVACELASDRIALDKATDDAQKVVDQAKGLKK